MAIIQGDISVRSLVRQFKHGIAILSNPYWISSSGFNLSVASLVGVAGFIFALRNGGSIRSLTRSSDRNTLSDELFLVPGLQNLGNNCFLNVVLQALASCSSFQSFLEKMLEEFEYLPVEERDQGMPLAVALEILLRELSNTHHGREVLSPRKVMLAIDHHIHNFNLTCQQDAEEALFHILSSLREEFSDCYISSLSSLAHVTELTNCRIITSATRPVQSEHERWQRSFVGPFDGILGSFLTCQSCSFQISLDFQFFHSLHLSPVMAGCSVEDCLKKFCAAELLENYYCTNCWHIAAIKFLSLMEGNETDIEKLKHCRKEDSCECKSLPRLLSLPWSNGFSRTFKQLNIARSPKILCLHIQRVSVNIFGEPIKLQGHVSFPLTLNLSGFINSEVGINKYQENLPNGVLQNQQYPHPFTTRMLNGYHGQMRNNEILETVNVADESSKKVNSVSDITIEQGFQGETSISTDSSYKVQINETHCSKTTSEGHRYRLVSVVQHFGRSGSGHYTVYRRVNNGYLYSSQWFCISDSDVQRVSEYDVLGAEASLLFYEKISEEKLENYSSLKVIDGS